MGGREGGRGRRLLLLLLPLPPDFVGFEEGTEGGREGRRESGGEGEGYKMSGIYSLLFSSSPLLPPSTPPYL